MSVQNPNPIVVAVGHDDPHVADSALAFAAAEALREGCGLHLVHALHVVSSGPELVLLDFSDIERIGRSVLDGAVERAELLVAGAVPVTSELVHGPAVPSVVEAALKARMIVLQHRDLSRVARVVTRSVSSGVAARAHVPVVSVPAGWTEGPPAEGPRLVTVGVDIPERCRGILVQAAAHARARGATLHILHTWWFPSVYDEVIMQRVEDDTWSKRAHRAIQDVLDELDGLGDVPVRVEARHAHPADALLAASQESELLVIGRHDPVVPIGSHLGPVARAVLRDAGCPVLLADPRGAHDWHPHESAAAESPTVQHA